MAASGVLRWCLRLSPVMSVAALAACTSVLGIEDLHEGPRPGEGGDDDTAGSSGASSSGGKSNAGGASSSAGSKNGGGTDSNGGSASPGGGGSASGGTSPEAGAGTTDPTPGPVYGTVIDFWGRALGNITVQVGTQQVVTDKDGKFSTDSVPAEYDASLKLTRESGGKVYGWVYQGLTRRDPTLQVFQGREDRSTTGNVTITTEDTVGANDTLSAAWGTPDGSREKQELVIGPPGNNFTPNWQGSSSISGAAHALLWTVNAATTLPSAYRSYDTKLIQLAEGTEADMTFTMKTMSIMSDSITGSVTPVGSGDRTNSVFVRFKSGASITLASHTPTTETFSYLVPQLTDASISVAAAEEDSNGGYSVIHKDGLNPGDSVGALEVPAPPVTLGPTGSTADTVDDATSFSFKGSTASAGAYVIHIEADQFYQSLFIVTQKTTFTIPKVLDGGYELTSGRLYRWSVETHGSLKTVDQMARAGGFADPYAGLAQWSAPGKPMGLNQDSGSYTSSGIAFFTLK
jgi:hypothetical protein